MNKPSLQRDIRMTLTSYPTQDFKEASESLGSLCMIKKKREGFW